MKPYFHEYRFIRDLAASRVEFDMRKWYLENPEPQGRFDQTDVWLTWSARLELEWESRFDLEIERLLAGVYHGRS